MFCFQYLKIVFHCLHSVKNRVLLSYVNKVTENTLFINKFYIFIQVLAFKQYLYNTWTNRITYLQYKRSATDHTNQDLPTGLRDTYICALVNFPSEYLYSINAIIFFVVVYFYK